MSNLFTVATLLVPIIISSLGGCAVHFLNHGLIAPNLKHKVAVLYISQVFTARLPLRTGNIAPDGAVKHDLSNCGIDEELGRLQIRVHIADDMTGTDEATTGNPTLLKSQKKKIWRKVRFLLYG